MTALGSTVGLPNQRLSYIVMDTALAGAQWLVTPAAIDSNFRVPLTEATAYYFEAAFTAIPAPFTSFAGELVLWQPSFLSFNQFPLAGLQGLSVAKPAIVTAWVTFTTHFAGALFPDDAVYAQIALDGDGQGPLYFVLAQAGAFAPTAVPEIRPLT